MIYLNSYLILTPTPPTVPTPTSAPTLLPRFYQNPFTGTSSKWKVTIRGLASGTSYWVGIQETDCLEATVMTVRTALLFHVTCLSVCTYYFGISASFRLTVKI